jgi:ZIP family zinc transporter
MDLFADGIMIGAGSTVAFSLALLIALGQVAADVPEGFAVVATMKAKGLSRRARTAVSASFVIPIMAGTVVSYLVVRGRSELVQYSFLMFAAGVLVTVVVEELVPEAHENKQEAHGATLSLVGGFALFAALAAYL